MPSKSLNEFYKSSPMREGVLCWYPFERSASILDLTGGALTELLDKRREKAVPGGDGLFDYIAVTDPDDFSAESLRALCKRLNPHGRLLLAYENPFALRYWGGKASPGTGLPYGSLFGLDGRPGKAEMALRLKRAGFEGLKWYYPLTDHWFAREIYSESRLPDECLNQRFVPYIEDGEGLNFDERGLYREVIRGGAFEFMCGAYLIEARACGRDAPCPVDYAAVTAYRDPAKRFATAVRNDGTVHKTPLHAGGVKSLESILRNHLELARLGVNVLPVKIENGVLTMPRVCAPTLWDYWAGKLSDGTFDENEMFIQFDRVRDAIYAAAKNGGCYWELVPANCFYNAGAGEMTFFDQEYRWDGEEPGLALVRAVSSLVYSDAFKADARSSGWLETLKERYGLSGRWDELSRRVGARTYEEVFGSGADALIAGTVRAAAAIAAKPDEEGLARARRERFASVPGKLRRLGFNSPVIYGFGKRGKDLLAAMESGGMEPAAVVDRAARAYPSLRLMPPGTSADIVIVSVLDGADEIKENLKDGGSRAPVFTLEELLDERA